jgi:transcriptional regulator with XRE-family HTH domain
MPPATPDLIGLVRNLRKSLGLTQVQLAEKLGITATSVHRYESGSSTPGVAILGDLFELACQNPASRDEKQKLETVLAKRLRTKGNKFGLIETASGHRPFLDVNLLASLSASEHDLLEATLGLIRSRDENAKRILRVILEPWSQSKSENIAD